MRITSLVENTSICDNIGAEHGLSLYVETEANKILFDMGQTDLFLKNAETMGIDLSAVDFAVLSHGHYDHGGGLKAFLQINHKAPVYISRYAFEPHFNGTERYIGLDLSLKDHERLIFVDDIMMIKEHFTLYHCNAQTRSFDLGSFGLNVIQNGLYLPDDFRHEQYLLIEEKGRRILISGCSHKGILNIAQWFDPDVLIGGFHFSKLPFDETLRNYAQHLNGFNTDYYTCHCTGVEHFAFMRKYMNRLNYLSAGQTIQI